MTHARTSFSAPPFNIARHDPQLWLDASDASTITTSSGRVTEWRDKAPIARHVSQSTVSFQPFFDITTFGKGSIYFNLHSLNRTITSGLGKNVQGVTAYSAHRPTDLTSVVAGRQMLNIGTGLGANRINLSTAFVNDQFTTGGRTLDADSFVSVQSSNKAANLWYVQVGVFDHANTDLYQYVNGALDGFTSSFQTATTTSDTASSGIKVGAFDASAGAAGNCYIGYIGEIIVFHSVHSAALRNAITNYLSAKWLVS